MKQGMVFSRRLWLVWPLLLILFTYTAVFTPAQLVYADGMDCERWISDTNSTREQGKVEEVDGPTAVELVSFSNRTQSIPWWIEAWPGLMLLLSIVSLIGYVRFRDRGLLAKE